MAGKDASGLTRSRLDAPTLKRNRAAGAVTARDYFWLDLIESGEAPNTKALAMRLGVSVRTVQLALQRARADIRIEDLLRVPREPRPPELVPLFGCQPFTPQTTCGEIHPRGPIPPSARDICMVCHKGGEAHS